MEETAVVAGVRSQGGWNRLLAQIAVGGEHVINHRLGSTYYSRQVAPLLECRNGLVILVRHRSLVRGRIIATHSSRHRRRWPSGTDPRFVS